MNPMQLRETTLDPNTRRLVQLTIDDEDDQRTDAMMDMLLAKKRSEDRRNWLQEKGDMAEIEVDNLNPANMCFAGCRLFYGHSLLRSGNSVASEPARVFQSIAIFSACAVVITAPCCFNKLILHSGIVNNGKIRRGPFILREHLRHRMNVCLPVIDKTIASYLFPILSSI